MPPTNLGDLRQGKGMTAQALAQQLGCSLSWLRAVEKSVKALAPNHPLLEKWAGILGLSVPEMQAFAKAEPYTSSQIKLALFRLGRTLPRGPKKALPPSADEPPKKAGGLVKRASFKSLRVARGWGHRELAQRLGTSTSFISLRVESGALPKNHPILPKLARVFGLTLPQAEALCHGKDFGTSALFMANQRLGQPGYNKYTGRGARTGETWSERRRRLHAEKRGEKLAAKAAVARGEKKPGKKPGTSLVHVPQKESAARRSTPMKRAYNALRLMDPTTRQCARSLAMATTLAAIKGEAYLDVAVPTEGMAEILNDWLRLKGIPEIVVLAVDYDKVFG